ncbi:MAG TPA: DUF1592 domain-containing protein, partial [Polyangiales bacterium]|nr:DUF1592 domain-containing protein [Polyangiales bacterium]
MTLRALGLAMSLAAGAYGAGCGDPGMGPQSPHSQNAGSPGGATGAPGTSAGAPGSGGAIPGATGGANSSGIDLAGDAKYFRFVRLTNGQWARSVQDLLKLPSPSGLEEGFQRTVAGTTDFSNNEHFLDVNQRAWVDYRDASEALAEQVTASSAALSALYPGSDGAGFVTSVGRRVYRRPLSQPEISAYSSLFTQGSAMSGSKSPFAKGAALVLRAMLQSPHFLYRTELQATGAALSGYELAAKLSLWLRGTTPSDALLASAEKLTNVDALSAQAKAMLDEPSALPVMREFQRELLHFDRYSQISKVGVPGFVEALNAELEETSYLFFDRIFSQGLGVKDIFTSSRGFVGPEMAKLYGLGAAAKGYSEHDLGPTRVGYFAQVPYLMLHSLNAAPDSIHRGVSLNLDVLCAPLGPPVTELPPIPPLQAGQTNRQRIDTLTSGCGGSCHNEMINPLGFAFEHFDGMGQYRDVENGGLRIDSSGSYNFSDGRKPF